MEFRDVLKLFLLPGTFFSRDEPSGTTLAVIDHRLMRHQLGIGHLLQAVWHARDGVVYQLDHELEAMSSGFGGHFAEGCSWDEFEFPGLLVFQL